MRTSFLISFCLSKAPCAVYREKILLSPAATIDMCLDLRALAGRMKYTLETLVVNPFMSDLDI